MFTFEAVDGGYRLRCGDSEVTIASDHQLAQKSQRENIIRQLSKLGNTVYTCERVEVADDFPYFIPSSVLAVMRRQLVEQISLESPESLESLENLETLEIPEAPAYPYDYLYNIANREAAAFYGADAPSAYELRGGDGPIMQCRHCIRYALGYCLKNPATRHQWREPLSLRLSDGRVFPLEFDCRHCQMNVYAK